MAELTSTKIYGNLTVNNIIKGSNGSEEVPTYSFVDDIDTGMYRVTEDILGFVAGGVQRMTISNAQIRPFVPIRGAAGSAPEPAYSFIDDTDMGMYIVNKSILGFSTGGVQRMTIGNTQIRPSVPIRGGDGSAPEPAYSFIDDTEMGMYRVSLNRLGFSTGGVQRMIIENSGVSIPSSIKIGAGGAYRKYLNIITESGNTGSIEDGYRIWKPLGAAGEIRNYFRFTNSDSSLNTFSAYYGGRRSASSTYELVWGTSSSSSVPTETMSLSGEGNLTVTGNITATDFILSSDVSLKENLVNISDDNDINYYSFNFKNDENKRRRYGVVAQEIQDKYPELISKDKDGKLSVSYIDLLITEIANLKNKIKDLENKIV